MAQNISYLTLAPFFPSLINAKGIDPFFNGVVFALYSVPFILSPDILANRLLPSLGRVHAFALGSLLLAIGMFLFSFIDVIPSKAGFIASAMITRLIEGIGAACLLAAGTSLLTTSFTSNLSRAMTLYSVSLGLGLFVGPIIGAMFYKIGGYRLPFIGVGILDLVLIFFMCTAKNDPQSHQPPNPLPSNQQPLNENHDESLRSWHIFKIPRANFAFLNYFGSSAILSFTETFLADKLRYSFDFNQGQIATYLFVATGIFVVTSLLLLLVPPKLDKRYVMIPSNFLEAFCLLLIGPSIVLKIPDKSSLVLLGLAIMGVSTANSAAFVTDEVVAGASSEYPEREERIANLTSGLRNMMFGLGQCFGALSGALLRKAFGL